LEKEYAPKSEPDAGERRDKNNWIYSDTMDMEFSLTARGHPKFPILIFVSS